jgi:hypothetical protein
MGPGRSLSIDGDREMERKIVHEWHATIYPYRTVVGPRSRAEVLWCRIPPKGHSNGATVEVRGDSDIG